MKKALIILGAVVVVIAGVAFLLKDEIVKWTMLPTESHVPQADDAQSDSRVVASRLDTPWSLAFLPAGDLLVTERTGQMRRVGSSGKVYPIAGVHEDGEGGLLGVALHPNFAKNSRLYLYFTTDKNGEVSNTVREYTLKKDTLTFTRTIVEHIPAAWNHNGGAVAFGPDDKLYVTTGDSANGKLAQDKTSLAGKILRMNDDGSVPGDNPYDNLVWSYGHRNPQGIAWDKDGKLWEVEHGPSNETAGLGGGRDELNLIEKGANYGWPEIMGSETKEGMRTPVANSGVDETWAPSGMAYYNGSLYFAGLRGQTLYEAKIMDDNKVKLSGHFVKEYGRLRAVAVRDDDVYFTTSNQDGRGYPADDDDKVLRVNLK